MDDPNEGVDHGCSREPAPKNDRLGSAINPTDTAATNSAQAGDRHLCRNPRCRLKLPAPVSNPKAAFCKRGCFEQFHRRRCVVCEQEYERKREDQRDCRRRKCRAELRRNRLTLLPFEVQKKRDPLP